MHDYFRTSSRGNASFNEMPVLHYQIKILLGWINKNNRNKSNLSEFLSSPFSPAVPKPMPIGNISLPLAAIKSLYLKLCQKKTN